MHRNRTWLIDPTETVLRTQRNRILPIEGSVPIDPTPGYNERFDGGSATTTSYPYRVDGRDAAFTLYSTVINGGQATNP
jgi:hypothetical protein